MRETQESICAWADETFGDASDLRTLFNRMDAEYVELLSAVERDDPAAARRECADVLITLYRVADYLSIDLLAEADRKMATNRERKWRLNGDGTAQHVENSEA